MSHYIFASEVSCHQFIKNTTSGKYSITRYADSVTCVRNHWRQHEQQGIEIVEHMEWYLKTFLDRTNIHRITLLLYSFNQITWFRTKLYSCNYNIVNANANFWFLKTIYIHSSLNYKCIIKFKQSLDKVKII